MIWPEDIDRKKGVAEQMSHRLSKPPLGEKVGEPFPCGGRDRTRAPCLTNCRNCTWLSEPPSSSTTLTESDWRACRFEEKVDLVRSLSARDVEI